VTQAGSTTYTYDADGNMVTAGGISLVYDGENRLVQDGTTSFVYAPDGLRLKKISGNTTTLYLGNDWEVSGGVNTFYLPGDAVMTNGVISWLGRDQINSVWLTTDANGAVVQRAHYRPYGERLETIAALMTSKGYIGQRNDSETGLIYLHARYYDPRLARFVTADPTDPTEQGMGLNRYAYAGNSPIVNLDPTGLRGEHPDRTSTTSYKSDTINRPYVEGRSDPGFSMQGRPGGPKSPNVTLGHAIGVVAGDTAQGAAQGAIGGAALGATMAGAAAIGDEQPPGVVAGAAGVGGVAGGVIGAITGTVAGFAYGVVHAVSQVVTDNPTFDPATALINQFKSAFGLTPPAPTPPVPPGPAVPMGQFAGSPDASGGSGGQVGTHSSYGGAGDPGALGAGGDPSGPPGSW
jgi:RHS repeat-associated protein